MFASWCLCFSHFADFSALFWTPSHQPGTHFTKTPGTHPSAASGRSVVGDVGRPTWICHFLEGNFFEAKLHQLEEVTSDKSLRWDIKFWMTVELYQSQVSLKLVYFSLTALPDSKYNVHLQTSPQKQSSIQTLQKGKTLQRTTKAMRL